MTLVAAICLYLLYRPHESSDTNTQVIAKVIGQFNTVKRKKDFFLSWKDTYMGDGLSKNDEIYTHENSNATIEFTNGNKVEISENSLIKIKTNLTQNSVEINKGNIVAELNQNQKNIEVQINGKKYQLSSENAKIQIEQNAKENKFILLEGTAAIKSGTVNTQLKNNEILNENIQTGKIETRIPAAILISPKRRSIFYFENSKSMHFEWKKIKASESIITMATDREFKNIITEQHTTENNFDYELTAAQTYFWKVTATDLPDSPIYEFELIKYPVIELRTNQNIFINKQNHQEKVLLIWDPVKHLKNVKYILSITDPDQLTKEVSLSTTQYTLPINKLGEYQFKIKPSHIEMLPNAQYGPITSVILKNIDKLSIENMGPTEIEKVWYKKTLAKTRINWNSRDKIEQYLIKVTSPDGKEKLITSDNNFIEIEHPITGDYSWEVTGKLGDTQSNKLTGIIHFRRPVKVTQTPERGAVIELQRPDQNVQFKWEALAIDNPEYEIEISKEENFENTIVKKSIKENNFSTSLNQLGIYFWRVKILNGKKVEYSEPTSIELRPIPPLSRPDQLPELKIQLKEDNKTSYLKQFLQFFIELAHASETSKKAEWTLPKNPRVKTYIIKIYSDPQAQNLIKTIESNEPHFIWSESKPGIYYWNMAYVDYFDRQTDFSKIARMEILDTPVNKIEKEKIQAPTINTPPIISEKPKIKKPNPIKIVDIPAQAIISNITKIKYQLAFTPQHYLVSKKTNTTIDIDGVNLESMEFTHFLGQNIFNYDEKNYQLKFNRGKVFKRIIFNDFEFNFKFKKDNGIYQHGPVFFLSKNSKFQVENNQVSASNQFNAILGYAGRYQLGFLNLEAALGMGTGLLISINGQYQVNEKYFFGLFLQRLENDKQTNQYLGLKFGYNFFE